MRILFAILAAVFLGGCATALVKNKAVYERTGADGVTEKRTAVNTIRAFGDRAVEQNLKGSLADATAEDLSAGISEATQKSEAGVIAEGLFNVLGKGIDIAAAYITRQPATHTEAANSDAERAESIAYSTEGYGAQPAEGGTGAYGRPSCSRCQSYRTLHGVEFVNIDNGEHRTAMWAALRARGYTGASVDLPVIITAEGYEVRAR